MSEKPAHKSAVWWGAFIAFLPAVDQLLSSVGVLPAAFLPDVAALVTTVVGGVAALVGRYTDFKAA